MRARRLSRGDHGHRGAARRVASDRRVDGVAPDDVARRQRQVLAGHASGLQLAHERRLRGQCLGDDQEAARVLVEAVDDPGARHAGKLRRVVQQRVQQRAVPVAAARVHDEACRLVDDEQRVVLGDDRQGDRFREKRHLPRIGGRMDHDLLAAVDPCGRRRDAAVDRDPTGVDPGPQARARELRQHARQRGIEAAPGGIGRQGQCVRDAPRPACPVAGVAASGSGDGMGMRRAGQGRASAIIIRSTEAIETHDPFAASEPVHPRHAPRRAGASSPGLPAGWRSSPLAAAVSCPLSSTRRRT